MRGSATVVAVVMLGAAMRAGYRVETARVPGIAARQAPQAQPQTTEETVFGQGLAGIFGTGGMKPARSRRQWRQE